MKNLKSNVDHYMELKRIPTYSRLLFDIACELGLEKPRAYKFAEQEKSNFSKMLKGERSLKYDFIIPLEKIFGVSLARLLEEEAYKLPAEKENIPFNKGFRYYAYLDKPELYKNELDILPTKDGKSILTQIDEFDKTFLDYIVEYGSVNGVRYLHDNYGIKLKWSHNQFEFTKDKSIWIRCENYIGFARLVASMNDVELFNDIYDSYHMFFTNGHYASENCIFCQGEYSEIILDNDDLFNSIFEIKPYELKLGNYRKRKEMVDSITYYCINPIINNCLKYALKHLDKYRHRAIDILKFGIDHNREIKINKEDYYHCNELGGLYKNNDYHEIIVAGELYLNGDCLEIVVADEVYDEVNDNEIKSLFNQMMYN